VKKDTGENSVQKPKTSRVAIASLILAILSFLFLLLVIPAIILSIGIIFKIRENPALLKGTCHAAAAIVISMTSIVLWIGACVVWSLDATPIPNDYTIADLRSAPIECNHSFELLLRLSEKETKDDLNMPDFIEEINKVIAESNEPNTIEALNAWAKKRVTRKPSPAPAIGLSGDDIKTIIEFDEVVREGNYSEIVAFLKANANNIYQAWKNAQKGRDVIKELNTFGEIADLSVPRLDTKMLFLHNLRLLIRLYEVYSYLQTEENSSLSAVSEIIELDSVFRKLNINARGPSIKLTCYACLGTNINTANFIVNNTKTSQDTAELLAKHFTFFTQEQSSMRNQLISEYLVFKDTLDTQKHEYYTLAETPFLKRNSTLRLFHNFCENRIHIDDNSGESKNPELSVWPSSYPNILSVSIDSQGKVPLAYTVYNPIGSILLGFFIPAIEHSLEVKTKHEVHYDLFQIVLNKRLGKEISLKARAYSDEYIIDVENKKIYSPGPDGKPHTEDDIKLIINPEVLGFSD
jgi:hypothetical protein